MLGVPFCFSFCLFAFFSLHSFAAHTDVLMRCTHVQAALWLVLLFALVLPILLIAHEFAIMLIRSSCTAHTELFARLSALIPNCSSH